MTELADIKATVRPTDTLLVVDAMTGQEAATLVKSFNDQVDITGVQHDAQWAGASDGRVLSVCCVCCCGWVSGEGGRDAVGLPDTPRAHISPRLPCTHIHRPAPRAPPLAPTNQQAPS